MKCCICKVPNTNVQKCTICNLTRTCTHKSFSQFPYKDYFHGWSVLKMLLWDTDSIVIGRSFSKHYWQWSVMPIFNFDQVRAQWEGSRSRQPLSLWCNNKGERIATRHNAMVKRWSLVSVDLWLIVVKCWSCILETRVYPWKDTLNKLMYTFFR